MKNNCPTCLEAEALEDELMRIAEQKRVNLARIERLCILGYVLQITVALYLGFLLGNFIA